MICDFSDMVRKHCSLHHLQLASQDFAVVWQKVKIKVISNPFGLSHKISLELRPH